MLFQLNLSYFLGFCYLCPINSLPTLDVAQKSQHFPWSQYENFNTAIKAEIAAQGLDSMVLVVFSNPNYCTIPCKPCLDYISNSVNIFSCFMYSCAQFYVFKIFWICRLTWCFHVLFLCCYRISLRKWGGYLNSATRCILLILSRKTSCGWQNVNKNNIAHVRSWGYNLVLIQLKKKSHVKMQWFHFSFIWRREKPVQAAHTNVFSKRTAYLQWLREELHRMCFY